VTGYSRPPDGEIPAQPARSEEPRSNAEIEPCLAVVMPVYNEAATVLQIIQKVLQQTPVRELIVVDDGSNDGSNRVLLQSIPPDPRLRVLRHDRNQGKGAAVRTALAYVSSRFVVIQDADQEYDPTEYYRLLGPMLTGKADVVYGSRFLGGGPHRVLYYWHSVGNRFLTTLSNMATNLNLTDMETCYKAFRRDVLLRLALQEARFGIEPEITAKTAKLRVRIYEVSISYNGRTYEEGKKIGWRDGFYALWCIWKYNFWS
jgi:glycosyltransferase involved in cell wall biosynthesis